MWSKTLGHSKQIEQLKKALKEGKVSHAYLFSGIEGIGKKRVALGFAQALNCSKSDLHFIEPEGLTIKIELLRQLKQKIYLHPLEGEVKVVIIDKADAMTEAGANALLKILEEPPPQTYFILISSQPTRLLPTIRSRCQHFAFSPLTNKEIAGYLIQEGIDPNEVQERTEFSGGSLKTALDFDAKCFKETKRQLEVLAQNPTPSRILDLSDNWSEEVEKIPFILTTLNHLWHKKILETQDEGNLGPLTQQWHAIQSAHRSLKTYANKQLLLESLLFQLSYP